MTPIAKIQSDQPAVGISTASVTFTPLTAITISGPALPAPVKQALESPTLAAAATTFVRSLPDMMTPPLLRTVIERVQPGSFPDVGTSIFNWFTVRLEASRVVVKPLEGVITAAVDFLGLTSGDPSRLVDLTTTPSGGNVWVEYVTPKVEEEAGPPYIVAHSYPPGGNLAFLFNMSVLSATVDSISQQTAHTTISQNIELLSLSAGYATFTRPLYPGVRNGLRVGFSAAVHAGGVPVAGALYFQPVVTIYDGPTNFLRAPAWGLEVVYSELSTSWYADLVVFAISAFAAGVLPWLIPVFAAVSIAVVDGVLPSLLDNARNVVSRGVEGGLAGLGLPSPTDDRPLPGLPGGSWSGALHHVAVTEEGLDTGLDASVGTDDLRSRLISPDGWHAEYRQPMPFSVKLSRSLEKMANNLFGDVAGVAHRYQHAYG